MIRRTLAAFAVSLLMVAAALGLSGTAQAKDIGACNSGYVCFWDWSAFNNGGAFYQFYVQDIYGGNCKTLPAGMVDRPTSLRFNNPVGVGNHHLRFFLWANCNAGGGYFTLADNFVPQGDLTCPTFMPPCNSFYNDNIVSVAWIQ